MKYPRPLTPSQESVSFTAEPASVVTLEMVAQSAGVSPSTVSRILNGTAVVSEVKKQAVNEAIARLGFVPNPIARGLAGGRTLSIGVVTQSIDSPFYGGALRGIEEALAPAGYSPLFVSGHWKAEEEKRCLDMLCSRRVDGLIVLTGRLSDKVLRTYAKKMPIVVTGRNLQTENLYAMSFDNFEGGRLATQHLLSLGHQNIAFIAGDGAHPDANDRHLGYQAALKEAGLAYDPDLVVHGHYHEESGCVAVGELLRRGRPFSAIFSANDQMALGAALGLYRHGFRVPEDVSVMGFDDLDSSAYALPPLSTVHHPAVKMGQLAATAMLSLLKGESPSVVLPGPRVVVRESTGMYSRCVPPAQ